MISIEKVTPSYPDKKKEKDKGEGDNPPRVGIRGEERGRRNKGLSWCEVHGVVTSFLPSLFVTLYLGLEVVDRFLPEAGDGSDLQGVIEEGDARQGEGGSCQLAARIDVPLAPSLRKVDLSSSAFALNSS